MFLVVVRTLPSPLHSSPNASPPLPTLDVTDDGMVHLFGGVSFWGGRLAIYKGTVNDPTTFPTPQRSAGSHHWTFERLLSAGLVPLTAAAFVTSGSHAALLDGLLGISLIVHSHIGVRTYSTYLSFPLPPPPSGVLIHSASES